MKTLMVIAAMVLFIAGCCSLPPERVSYRNAITVDPVQAREGFASLLPQQFSIVDSIVFQYGKKPFSAIGYTEIDSLDNMFKAACLNHAGVKLLELKVIGHEIKYGYALEELSVHGDIVQAMATDIQRIYFDRVPSPEAETYKERYQIVYREIYNEGILEYVFAGEGPFLVRKTYFEKEKSIWSVSYYKYMEKDGKIYPKEIVFKHHQYDYRLTIKLKEIR